MASRRSAATRALPARRCRRRLPQRAFEAQWVQGVWAAVNADDGASIRVLPVLGVTTMLP